MENASKALLIAGAILICILLIAIGMYIYQSAQATIDAAASKMSNQDKEIYNSMIKKYVGENKRGSDVKAMIEQVISQNDQYVGESGKFISIKVGSTGIPNLKTSAGTAETAGTTLGSMCDLANVYASTPGDNTQTNVDNAKKEMRALYKAISSGKSYRVSDDGGVKDGIIHTVTITEM